MIDAAARTIGDRAAEKLASAGRRAFGRGDASAAASLLHRAAVMLPANATARIELLSEFAEASIEQGRFDAAREAIDEAGGAAKAAGDARLVARSAFAGYLQNLASTGSVGNVETAVGEIHSMIEVFDRSGDPAGLARAWHLLSVLESTAGQYDRAAEAGQQTVRHGREASDARFIARGVLDDAYASLHGTTPAPEALRRCEEYLPLVRGNRTAEAILLGVLAQLTAMTGAFGEARSLAARSREVIADLGPSGLAASLSDQTSRVEVLAGDLEAAARELRRDYDVLEAMNEAYYRSTIAALLGRVLWDLKRPDEARVYARISRELADADDVYSQVLWRVVEAKCLARSGTVDEAQALAKEAIALVATTADIELRADTLLDYAEVLRLIGLENEQGPHLREALALYRQKGDVVLAVAAERLAESAAVIA